MSDKENTNKTTEKKSVDSSGELDQLRLIVFGEAQQQLNNQILTLRIDTEKSITALETKLSERISQMQESIAQQFLDVEKQLQFIDKTHDDNEANIQKDLASLASEHEMLDATTQQDFKNIQQLVNDESNSQTSNFNEQLELLKSHLETVSHELSSSKTDRKMLAKLLATMATNLEDDHL
ncbi:MAG: hypothetical protein OCD00_02160 [Colwellia sp.]